MIIDKNIIKRGFGCLGATYTEERIEITKRNVNIKRKKGPFFFCLGFKGKLMKIMYNGGLKSR